MRGTTRILLTLAILAIALPAAWGDVPSLVNYQGRMEDSSGDPITTTVSVLFAIWNDPTVGDSLWSEQRDITPDADGLFDVLLGSLSPIPDSAFSSADAYLSIKISTDPEISPRTRLVTVPYAYRVSTVDGSTGGTVSGDVSIASDLTVSGKATIGPSHTNTGTNAFVAGRQNEASGLRSVVSGGYQNRAVAEYTTVSGGDDNNAEGNYASVGGGSENIAYADYSTVGGGHFNWATSQYATVGGGSHNWAWADYSTVGGGRENSADGNYAAVSGGYADTATADYATVSGGSTNTADADYATVSGGRTNTADGEYATVSGGYQNIASGRYATVPGGVYCDALGMYSFAAGVRAKALHAGCFVWGDSTSADVASDTTNQFKIRASNGVRLASDAGTDKPISMGDRYRDNGIVAWGKVTSGGELSNEFGVTSVVRNGTGDYTVTLNASASTAGELVPVANAEIDEAPMSAYSFRMVAIDQVDANIFNVYIMNGVFIPIDNDFVFVVTGR